MTAEKSRLDRQAEAIRDLRARVAALEEALEGALSALQQAGDLRPPWAPYVPQVDCAMCSEPKEPGRLALTCRSCAARRQKIIAGEIVGRIRFTQCHSCKTPYRKPSTLMLCSPCSAGFKKYKDSANR